MRHNKPNLFIVGAAKAGTTALQKNLSTHPDVYFSPVKEPHFFSDDIDISCFRDEFATDVAFDLEKYLSQPKLSEHHQAFVRGEGHYMKLFKGVSHQKILAEASASYLWSTKAAENIFSFNKDAKIIMLLRNPVERAFSHYMMDARMGYTKNSFLEALKEDNLIKNRHWGNASLYVDLGLYGKQVERYLRLFPKEQILLIWHNDLKEHPQLTSKKLFDFLGIEPHAQTDIAQQHNTASIPKNSLVKTLINNRLTKSIKTQKWAKSITPMVSRALLNRSKLPEITAKERIDAFSYFEEDICRLESLLKVNLDHWRV